MWTKQSKQSAIYKREVAIYKRRVACVDSGADVTIARLSKAGEG